MAFPLSAAFAGDDSVGWRLGHGRFVPRGAIDCDAIVDYIAIMLTRDQASMTSITIRNLDPAIKDRLRIRAAERGHSMEAEVRDILQMVLRPAPRPSASNLYERIHARFAPLGGADDVVVPPRAPDRDPPRFD
jgi:plasmid stability protein